jgi:hypothetical protein
MNSIGRIFLEQGVPKDHNGSRVHLGLTFTTEEDLDRHLWLDPEIADEDFRYLLKVHQHEMTPALSRIALKAIAWPLFIREYYGEQVPDELSQAIQTIPERSSRLLDAYMDRVGDPDVDQIMLKQAIDDTSTMHIVNLPLRTPETNDIILLPAGPEEDHIGRPTSFTVLRREKLGRALLFVSSVRPTAHINTPQANEHRIHIRPNDLLINGASRYDLAEAIIAEQRNDIEPEDRELIMSAQAHIHTEINNHFNRIDTHRQTN